MEQGKNSLTLAVIGAGYAARLHGDAYKRVYGAAIRLKWIIDPIMERAEKAGKHVICEKPLLGYFGEEDDPEPIGLKVPKSKMYAEVLSDMEQLSQVLEQSGKVFCYAENYVYSAAVQRAAELIRHKKSKLLFLKGEESLKGSQALSSGEWKHIGGGSLIRAGVHPLSSLLMLKQTEAKARGEEIGTATLPQTPPMWRTTPA